MDSIEQLQKRIESVEKECVRLTFEAKEREIESKAEQVDKAKASLTEIAFRAAIQSLGEEIGLLYGISVEQFGARFQRLMRWHLDQLLQTITDTHPDFAALIDTRTVEQIPTEQTPPKLFAPPSDQ